MRNFLLQLVEKITNHPRYHPEDYELDHKLHWTNKIWIANVFRAYEWLFGRGYGIRREAVSWVDDNGEQHHKYFSFEAKIVAIEVIIRECIALFPTLFFNPNINYQLGGIAFDAVSNGSGNANSLTVSHTCTGSNGILFAGAGAENAASSDQISGITYNAISMALVDKQSNNANADGQNYWNYQFVLVNPATGANNIVISAGSTINIRSVNASYSGANQSGQPDSHGKATSGTTDLSVSITVVAANCWIVSNAQAFGVTPVAGTGLTSTTNTNNNRIADSNGVVSPGSNTVHWTQSPSVSLAGIATSFAPIAGASSLLLAQDI